MPSFDSLGDRMKFYEGIWGGVPQLMPLIPAVIRLDGKAFHTFTKGMDKPFDMGLINLMIETTKALVEDTNACVGYTQSDEITLILMTEEFDSQIYFDGRVDKINSILAGTCANEFNSRLGQYIPDKAGYWPVFDCRCFNVPNEMEAVNALIWREQDATRNSIQMAGQAEFSHNQLMHKSCNDIQEMLWSQRNINWNDYPDRCKRGTYIQRRKVVKPFTTEEIDRLPAKHAARANPLLTIERTVVNVLPLPPITKLANVTSVVFRGADPVLRAEA